MLATFARLSIGFGWCINPCKQVYWDKNVLLKVGDDAASNTIRGPRALSRTRALSLYYRADVCVCVCVCVFVRRWWWWKQEDDLSNGIRYTEWVRHMCHCQNSSSINENFLMRVRACVYSMHVCTYVYTDACMYVYTDACMYICIYVCMYADI